VLTVMHAPVPRFGAMHLVVAYGAAAERFEHAGRSFNAWSLSLAGRDWPLAFAGRKTREEPGNEISYSNHQALQAR
jgi:hypothetical protein